MITLKIKYNTNVNNINIIKEYQRQYTICYKVIYKYLKLGLNKYQIKEKLKNYKNINLIINNSWFMNCLFYDVKCILKEANNVCFNYNLHLKRNKNLITKQEFKENKYFQVCSNGEIDKKSNRFFKILNINQILFKPNKYTKILLNLQSLGKNRVKILQQLLNLQNKNNILSITYKLNKDYIYLTFDESNLSLIKLKPINNRIFAIDMNPNYIGYSIIDWKDTENLKFNLINTGIISLKSLNDKYFSFKKLKLSSNNKLKLHLTNKRKFEIFEVSKQLIKLAKHYRCEFFAIEDLNIKSNDKNLGKKFNSLCNNLWNRDKLQQNIQKRCNLIGIKFQKIIANYSSILGNSLYRNLKLPDMILSSIEISRRCQEFNLQYIKKSKKVTKNIIFPNLTEKVRNLLNQTVEVLGNKFQFETINNFCYLLKKNFKNKYRVHLDLTRVFRQKHLKYQLINFI